MLVDWLERHEEGLKIERWSEEQECLILKLGKDRIDYKETEETQRLRQVIQQTNEARLQHQWTYHPMEDDRTYIESGRVALSPHELRCQRVFNGDFESGGRFHCAAQRLRKAERATIEIDDEATTEWDFKSMHPQMLYHLNGQQPPKDCYDPHGQYAKEKRALQKSACQMILNGHSTSGAAKSLKDAVLKDTGYEMPYEDAKQVVLDFESDHSLIQEHFYSGVWKRLQFLDSSIAERVMLRCMDKDIPVLSVHDSFLTTTKLFAELHVIVKEAYQEVMGWEPVVVLQDVVTDFSAVEHLIP